MPEDLFFDMFSRLFLSICLGGYIINMKAISLFIGVMLFLPNVVLAELEIDGSLDEPDWTTVSGTMPSVVGDEYQMTTGPVVVKHYYRLQKP